MLLFIECWAGFSALYTHYSILAKLSERQVLELPPITNEEASVWLNWNSTPNINILTDAKGVHERAQ